jgi:hypothetical protein
VFGFKTLYATAGFISAAMFVNFATAYFILIKITLRQSLYLFFKELIKPFFCAVLSGIALFLCDSYFKGNLFFSLTFKTVIAGAVLAGINGKSLVRYIKEKGHRP